MVKNYKNCAFCSKRYHHAKNKVIDVCNNCIAWGLTDPSKPLLSSKCQACKNIFNYQGATRKVCNFCINQGYLDNGVPLYKNKCDACNTSFQYQNNNKRKICDMCLSYGLLDNGSALKSTTCVVCQKNFKYQTGNPKKCFPHKTYKTLTCGYCKKDSKTYDKQSCSKCTDIMDDIIKGDNSNNDYFKQNYMLLCYYSTPYYNSIDIDPEYTSCIDFNIDMSEIDYKTCVFPLVRSIKPEHIDKTGYIDKSILTYYMPIVSYPYISYNINWSSYSYNNNTMLNSKFATTNGLTGYNLVKAKVIKKSELFDVDEFKDD